MDKNAKIYVADHHGLVGSAIMRNLIVFDESKLDGAPRKLMNVSHLKNQGWVASTSIIEGLTLAYGDYIGWVKNSKVKD